jgi:hypothetical protein
MSADSIARLSRKLLGSPLAENGSVGLHSSNWQEDLRKVDSHVRDQAVAFVNMIRDAVPTDFSFLLFFNCTGIRIHLSLEDGNTTADVGTLTFTSIRSLKRWLRKTDWNELRGDGIAGGSIFDDLVNAAEDRPVDIPSSAEAAKLHADELASAVAAVRARKPLPQLALIVYRDDAGLEIETMEDREHLLGSIGDCMTTQYDILSVLERGVSWSWDEVEAAKLEAVEGLGPISRAKAERRFLV